MDYSEAYQQQLNYYKYVEKQRQDYIDLSKNLSDKKNDSVKLLAEKNI